MFLDNILNNHASIINMIFYYFQKTILSEELAIGNLEVYPVH